MCMAYSKSGTDPDCFRLQLISPASLYTSAVNDKRPLAEALRWSTEAEVGAADALAARLLSREESK